MNTRIHVFALLLCTLLFGCGEQEPPPDLILSGTVEGEHAINHSDKPILVAVMNYNGAGQLNLDDLTDVVKLVSVDKQDLSFNIDLTDSGLWPGDQINIAAFVDVNADGQFPNPDPGDYLGLFMDDAAYSTAYTLAKGTNSDIQININRTIYDCSAQISFQFSSESSITPQAGEAVIAIAVAQQGVDLMAQTIDMDYVVATDNLIAEVDGPPYTIEVFPALFDGIDVSTGPFTISDLYLFAIIDDNNNGTPDPGEYLGYSGSRIPLTQIYLPRTFDISNGVNETSNPVVFTGNTFQGS